MSKAPTLSIVCLPTSRFFGCSSSSTPITSILLWLVIKDGCLLLQCGWYVNGTGNLAAILHRCCRILLPSLGTELIDLALALLYHPICVRIDALLLGPAQGVLVGHRGIQVRSINSSDELHLVSVLQYGLNVSRCLLVKEDLILLRSVLVCRVLSLRQPVFALWAEVRRAWAGQQAWWLRLLYYRSRSSRRR